MRALFILPLLLVGCSESAAPEPPWHGRDLTEDRWSAESPIFDCSSLEFDFQLAAGETLSWDWFITNQTAVEFQLHRHEGDTVRILHFDVTNQGVGEFVAPQTDLYSMIWTHRGANDITWYYDVSHEFSGVLFPLDESECGV